MNVLAQELRISKLSENPQDNSAKEFPRLDINKAPCALIKVFSPDNIRKVEGNILGQIEDKGREKWVYVSSGTKRIDIISTNHIPITIPRYRYRGIQELG